MIVQAVRALGKEHHQRWAVFTTNMLKNGTKRPRECLDRPGLISQLSTMAKESSELDSYATRAPSFTRLENGVGDETEIC